MMGKFKKAVSALVSAAVAASVFSAFAVTAGAKTRTLVSYDFETGEPWTISGANAGVFYNEFKSDTSINSTVYDLTVKGNQSGDRSCNVILPESLDSDIIELSFDFYLYKMLKGNTVVTQLQDSSGRTILKLSYDADNKIAINDIQTTITQAVKTSGWYRLNAGLDFTQHKIVSLSISQNEEEKYKQEESVDFLNTAASDLGKIALDLTKVSGGALYDGDGLKLDNFSATEITEDPLTYADGKVKTTSDGVVIVASYSGDRMTNATTYNVTAGVETAVDAAVGDKIMLWDSRTNAAPLSEPITVTPAPTEEPTEEPTQDVDQIPNELIIGGGQSLIAAPKTADTSSTEPFTVTVNDDAGAVIAPRKYSLEWAVYPAGTTTADSNVTISEGGIVSVSKNFMADGSVAAYDVVAKIEMKDAGQRGLNAAKTIYIGKNDVIYYEPIAWSQAGGNDNRTGSVSIASAVTLPDLSSITLNLAMAEPEGQRTLFLVTNTGNFVGLQYQKADGKIVVGTGWSGNTNMNQYGDIDKFTNKETLITGYKSNSPIEVTFTIDKTTNTVTVSSGTSNVSLPFVAASPTTFTGFKTGLYRAGGAMTMADVTVTEPDPDYLSIVGDEDFAKAYGTTVTRDYALNQSIIVSGETFSWTVSPANSGVTVDNGKLSVADSATPGKYTLTATSNSRVTKTASLEIEVGGFQTISQENAAIEGANTYGGVGQTGTYRITKLIDSYGDDVADVLPAAVWTSSNTSVASITADGALTVTGKGTATLTATITNGTAVSTFTVPIKVNIYFITAGAIGNSTAVDTSGLITSAMDSAITGYQVTTSKAGKLVKQTVVTTAPTTVDTTGADKLEIAPVFTVKGVTKSTSKTVSVPADTYNFNITGASGGRFDPYVNDQMLANNMLQGGTAVNKLAINDVAVNEGYATIKLEDAQSNSNIGTLTIVKSPSIVDRVKKVYVLGDSLVCIYYNGGNASNNYQTGWGQVLQSYLTDDYEVVDLGNSGVTAEGLAGTAITQVAVSGKPGDIMLLESGYNDRSYITEARMKDAVRSMYDKAAAAGVEAVLVTPNASAHDFKESVSWSGYMKDVANEKNAKLIDLSALSYKFFTSVGYTGNTAEPLATYNVSDKLHSTYHGAHKMASIVAGAMIDVGLGSAVDTSYTYTFTDTLGNTITCQASSN